MTLNIANYFKAHVATPDLVLYRQWRDNAWADVNVAELAKATGRWQSAFDTLGMVQGDRVALCLRNSVEWIAIDLAALGLGLVVVPLYVDDNPENIAWCVANAEARCVIVESTVMAQSLARCGTPAASIHVMRPDAGSDSRPASALLPPTTSAPVFGDLPESSLATICFTSGTSGRPKGVMLSHANIVANVASCQQTHMARPTDIFLSILPLSHMFERTGGYYLPLSLGAKVVFSRGVAQIADDLAQQSPTVMFAVPRIFEKFAARLDETLAASPTKHWLFDQCVARGWRVEQGGARPIDAIAVPLLRALVAKPIFARLGGRLRLTVVGGAALDPLIARTFIGLGLSMLQGYGMTEASPVISVNRENDNDPESVGPPLPGVEVALGAHAELLARGGNVMQGYWKNPEATHAAIDAEGWLHTGDIAEIRDGRIYIRGRMKDVLVMSNGEKLPPQDVEFALARDPLFEQSMLVGEGRPFLVLLTVSREADPKRLLARANELLRKFPAWVRIRKVIATEERWTIENGLLTPTLKLKRAQVLAHFKDAIDKAYAGEHDASGPAR